MTTTAIRNLSRTMLVLNLPREVAPKRAMYSRTVTHRDGTQERKDVRVVHGDSIHLLVGETKGGYSNAIRTAPDVIAAARARRIELIEEADPVVEVSVEVVVEGDSIPKPEPMPEPEEQRPEEELQPEPVIENDDTRGAPASKPVSRKAGR